MSSIQKYNVEFIFKFKNDIRLSSRVKEKMKIIKELMISSTDSKNFKVKISKDIKLNTNKWHRKRFITEIEKIKKKINSNLNMYSKINFEKISEDFLKLKISSEEEINYLMVMVLYKYKNDYLNDTWNYLINRLIFCNVNKWKINDKYLSERMIDKIQNDFEKIINSNYQESLEEYYKKNIQEFYKIKKKNFGLMKLIAEFFKINLICKDIITFILEKLTLDASKYYKLELGIMLVKYLFKYITDFEKNKFIDYFSYYLKNKNLNKKIKFMILDFIENNNNKNLKVEEPNKIDYYMTDDQVEAKIKSNINDYIFENNLDEFIESISKINLPSKSNKIIYYWILYILENESNMEIGIKLLNVCIQKKIIKYNTLKYGLIEFLSDYDSFKWDYPNLNNILNEIFLSCKKNRFLTFDNLKFIISKGNKKLEDTFKI
tara:strand:- start:609 stop:1907 length:1299 start_codon:yes stop_codon:yes gene_type:complete